MRVAGKRHAEVLRKVCEMVKPGVTTGALDAYAEKLIREYGDVPAFLNYRPAGVKKPFPKSICVSVNDEIVHGIPSDDRMLLDGDIVSIDIGLKHDGVFTDAAVTIPVGNISHELQNLLATTEEALRIGIDAIVPGAKTGDIGYAIEQYVAGRYGIVREYSGHGVGRAIHEDPYVPNYGKPGTGELLKPGMTIAIEPMLNIGKKETFMLDDGYTVVTRDGKPSAHFEHTVLITETGYEILTK